MTRIAVDAMGGDFAPREVVLGAVDAARQFGVEVILVGDQKAIEPILSESDVPSAVRVEHASQVIPMGAHPVEAIRKLKDASIVVATELVKAGRADAVVSAGSTGAAMASALLRLGRIRGVDRPAISSLVPTESGVALMLDVGANVDSRPAHLVQFACMGSVYAETVMGIPRPRVGLINIGEEETKGSDLVREVYAKLQQTTRLNFIGNVEGRDVTPGNADVFVCDGFVGNVVLKFAEGMATSIFELLRDTVTQDFKTKLGGMLLKPALQKLKQRMDYTEYGGAPLLGVKGVCIISHGRSNAKAIRNAVRVAAEAVEGQVVGAIEEILQDWTVSVP